MSEYLTYIATTLYRVKTPRLKLELFVADNYGTVATQTIGRNMNFDTTNKGSDLPNEPPKYVQIPVTDSSRPGKRFELKNWWARKVAGSTRLRRLPRSKVGLILVGIVALLLLVLAISLALLFRSPAYSSALPEGDVPEYDIRAEQDFTIEDFRGKEFAVVSKAISSSDLRKMTQEIRHDNPRLDLLTLEFYAPFEKKSLEYSALVRVANSRDALEAQQIGVSLGQIMSDEELDELWNEQDGVEVLAFAESLEELEREVEEGLKEIEEGEALMEKESKRMEEEAERELEKMQREADKQFEAISVPEISEPTY